MYGLFLDGLLIAKREQLNDVRILIDALTKQDPWRVITYRQLLPGEQIKRRAV